jgi:hypothetical protein
MKAAHTQRAVPQTEHEADPLDVQILPAKYVQVGEFRGRLRFHLERKDVFAIGSSWRPKAIVVPMPPRWSMKGRQGRSWRRQALEEVKLLLRECFNG